MSTEEIKLRIFRQVDAFDAAKLKEFYGFMQNYINSKIDTDEWLGISTFEKEGIEAAVHQMDAGKGIPQEQMMNRLRQKYTHV
ncbi:MAG: hypothetical protein WCG93_12780 [Paludibacter sp.]